MNKQQILANAKRTVANRRFAAENKVDLTLDRLRANGKWTQLEYELRSAEIDLAMGNGEANELRQKVELLRARQQTLLNELGVDKNALIPHYVCSKCNDTGYIDGKMCECLKKELRLLIIAESNVTNAQFTFDNSTEKNKQNLAVYKKAKELCLAGKGNILLTGNVGTGKTYLLTACANLCADLGKSVLFVTAFSLNRSFLEAHLSDLADRDAILDTVVDVDLLLIDDLGTENIYRNVTAEYLFAVLNERIARQKQTFITTNLKLDDFRERYDERIFSRLVDRELTLVAELVGKDKRIFK